jgi:hypothetical protein
MTNSEYYDRGYSDGLANQPYNRRLSGYNYYHGFKAGQHVRRRHPATPRKHPSRLHRCLRWTGKIIIVVIAHVVRAVVIH